MKRLLPALLLLGAACASSTPPPQQVPAPLVALSSTAASDLTGLRRDLEETYAQIVAREAKPDDATAVDFEAAASMEIPDNRMVRNAVTLFSTTMKSDIQTYLNRSTRWRRMIDRALAEEGLPKGLAYLPVIESGYALTLTSRAGAYGMWQFMEPTAREYGLRVDWWVDERADPERATRAAAAYLKDLHRQFDDWPLALAAYNGGPGRISRALKANGVSTFWDLCELAAIPRETRGYVPTFYATLIIASDPAAYGFNLTPAPQPEPKKVEVDGPVSLSYLARYAGVEPEMLKELNPSLRRGLVPPGRNTIRVPEKVAAIIAARSSSIRNDDPDMAVTSFRLREGDSVRRLARAVGASVESILSMNGLRSASAVAAGDLIYLPVRARELGARLNESDEVYYAVRKGDTLYSIAKRHHLTVDEIRDLNDLSRQARLRPGQRILVTPPRTLTAGGM